MKRSNGFYLLILFSLLFFFFSWTPVRAGIPWSEPPIEKIDFDPDWAQKCEVGIDSLPPIPDPVKAPSREEDRTIFLSEIYSQEQPMSVHRETVQIPWTFWLDLLAQTFY